MEFNKYRLKELAKYKNERINTNQLTTSNYISTENLLPNKQGKQKANKLPSSKTVKKYTETDILVSNIRPYFKKIWQADNIGGISNDVLNITSSNEKISNDYLYYYLSQDKFFQYMTQTSKGTKMPRGDKEAIMEFEIQVPKNVKYQNFISNLGKFLDNKIEINNKIIANLEELSQTLFKRWFVDFEFPDKDGNPYKSSGGEMIDSELGEIPKNWSIKTVKEIAESFNSIRKPLSKIEREKRESIYPYYGATKIIDYVDNYIFDGKYILVGEDGTVQTETGNPFIQYVWGKFWVSNHAHILKGKLISDELLMLYLKNTNVAPYITGAVQPKLNKKNLNSIKFVIADKETIIKFENSIKSYFQKIRILNKENKKLIELRDTLLPKLMFGEIEIPDDIEVNSDELSI
ncbi:restriction endonuclease subunit S [Staphylococcus hominis]|uniref:restriction endonuclease subunit S n=1 Tax=Staphylococcus hominis TaxID=1290 RepID=UPI001F27490C|nr:restriction endonuclease subunit S [Staphylococcus hominis]MCE4990749.1 restriction endonuclease subunit S [Staphylococcus hominis]